MRAIPATIGGHLLYLKGFNCLFGKNANNNCLFYVWKNGKNAVNKFFLTIYLAAVHPEFTAKYLFLEWHQIQSNVWVFLPETKINSYDYCVYENLTTVVDSCKVCWSRFWGTNCKRAMQKKILDLEFHILTTCQCSWLGKHLWV